MQTNKETMQIITSYLEIKVELRMIFKKELWYGEIKRRKKEKSHPVRHPIERTVVSRENN